MLVAAPRVAGAPAALECKVTEIFEPKDLDGSRDRRIVVVGEVVGIHIDDAMLTDGLFDVVKAGNVARLGYMDYLASSPRLSRCAARAGRPTDGLERVSSDDLTRPPARPRQQPLGAAQMRPVVHLPVDADDAGIARRRERLDDRLRCATRPPARA